LPGIGHAIIVEHGAGREEYRSLALGKYDVLIVGAGPSGIFTAFEIKKNHPDAKILMIEMGNSIEKRKCPKRKTGICANCNPCNITTGFSGSGSFSDGKLTINEHGEIGGNLIDYIGPARFREVLHYTDGLYLEFGADQKIYGSVSDEILREIRKKAFQADLHFIYSKVRHLGTEKAYEVYARIQKVLESMGLEMRFNTMVEDLIVETEDDGSAKVVGVVTHKGERFFGEHVVIGAGRVGSDWLKQMCQKYEIAARNGTIDIGVRVETDASITAHIDDVLYEAKLVNYSHTFDDKVRTFCWNPRGEVSEEKYGDLAVVNGHSYKGEEYKTNNTNFALLVSKHFTEPFRTPIEYGQHIAMLGNMLSGGKVIVQRYGDFKRGRRSYDRRILRNNIQPTLRDAVPGDLGLVLPYRLMLNIVETIEALDAIMPGLAADGTLLYGVEVKFYSNRLIVGEDFQTSIKNLYALGDGAGITRGLIQASMNGVCMGRILTGTW